MEMKNKAKGKKIFPSEERNEDYNSILKLLPLSIFTLIISVLSLKEREVVAYMLNHITFCSDHAPMQRLKSHNNKKTSSGPGPPPSSIHKSPVFDCHCFDCYHSYWGVWHNSPNHHLIDKAIEAFEDNLIKADNHKFNRNNVNRKKAKSVRRVAHVVKPLKEEEEEEIRVDDVVAVVTVKEEDEKDDVAPFSGGGHIRKGLMTKLLPDVWGLFNSRWWNLWGPNI
ncbi:hypothetical protein ACFE04_025097 [Oxalis oulophora]